tara:strand:- start:474 stop:2723 length:2250 start_codon:yes stop_codon:yes gene_type:complete
MDERNVEQLVDQQIAEEEGTSLPMEDNLSAGSNEPRYRVSFETKIPVAKANGKLWQQRVMGAMKNREGRGITTAWDEALRYYNNNQTGRGVDRDPNSQNTNARRHTQSLDSSQWAETENVVYANIASMIPHIYAKNPSIEITPNDSTDENIKALADAAEKLAKVLSIREGAPGLHLKPKAKRATVNSLLTNSGWLHIGYTQKENSADKAYTDLQQLAKDLEEAKTPQEIIALEGKIQGLEQKVFVLTPEGPWVKFRSPSQVVIDPSAQQDDGCDGNWMAVNEYMSTPLINAVYGKTDKEGKTTLLYKPTHVLRSNIEGKEGHDDNIFTSLSGGTSDEHAKFGFDTDDEFKAAQQTKVWWVYDKTTRRIFLYADNDWTWPIWVWDDPTTLDRFYPLYRLVFHTSPTPGDIKGEVTYILDQQDAINEINHEQRLAMSWARKNVFFDKRSGVTAEDVAAVLNGPTGTAKGINVPEGKTMKDVIFTLAPPSLEYPKLFDKSDKYKAIDQLLSTSAVLRGGQFKTNTTNKAVDQYAGIQAGRLDEFVDAIEDFLGRVLWGVLQMCLQFMSKETVMQLIGKRGDVWVNMSPAEIMTSFSVQVAGGSSAKPTSAVKKAEALEISQVLGQFAGAAPTTILVIMKVLQRAFDEVVMTDEDWETLLTSVAGAQGQGQGEQGGAPPQQGAPPGGQGGQGASTDVLDQTMQMIDSLPPEAKQALGQALAEGVPIKDALSELIAQLEQGQQQPQSQPQPQQP